MILNIDHASKVIEPAPRSKALCAHKPHHCVKRFVHPVPHSIIREESDCLFSARVDGAEELVLNRLAAPSPKLQSVQVIGTEALLGAPVQ